MRSLPRKAVLRHPALNPGSYADWEKCRRQLRPPNGRRLKVNFAQLVISCRGTAPGAPRPVPSQIVRININQSKQLRSRLPSSFPRLPTLHESLSTLNAPRRSLNNPISVNSSPRCTPLSLACAIRCQNSSWYRASGPTPFGTFAHREWVL